MVTPIQEILRLHGVSAGVGSCPDLAVRASVVEAESGSYRLHIEDAFGRQSDRQIDDAETAASLIESWAVLTGDTLRSPPPPAAFVRRAMDDVAPDTGVDAVRWRLSGALELAGSSDESFWYGGAVTGCATLAALCLGGRLRVARDNGEWGSDRDVSRSGTELLLLAALPLARRSVTVTPMLGLGVGWIRTDAARPDADTNTGPSDDLGLRVEAAASAGLALSRHVSLVGEIGASWGRSFATVGREPGDGAIVDPPTAYLRTAVACQYVP